jgi:hypothetical protein
MNRSLPVFGHSVVRRGTFTGQRLFKILLPQRFTSATYSEYVFTFAP